MRQIYCADKECELLPAGQSGGGIQGEQIVTASTGGLIPEANSASVPFSSVKRKRTARRRKKQTGGGKWQRPRRTRKIQVGGGKKRTKKQRQNKRKPRR